MRLESLCRTLGAVDETHAVGDDPWHTIGWEMLDLTRLVTIAKFGEFDGWPDDLERFLQRIDAGVSVEDHFDVVGRRLVEATSEAAQVPKKYVGLAWWIFAELREFPVELPGHDRAIALASRWRHHLEQAYGAVTVTG